MTQQFVIKHQKDDAVPFEATLTDDAGAPITTGVTIDVFDPAGVQVVTGGIPVLIDAPTGLWRYILVKTLFTVYGIWTGQWLFSVNGTARSERRLVEAVYA